MKTPKQQIRSLYDASFPEDLKWNDWYFDKICQDANVHFLEKEDRIVSCLVMDKYAFDYHGTNLPLGYISGACTTPYSRHKGYMSELMVDTLGDAYDQGLAFAGLIPAHDRLYFFYDKFGFSTVVYIDCERYTSVHRFERDDNYTPCEPTYQTFAALERLTKCNIVHSHSDYEAICGDIAHDGGVITAVSDHAGNPAAMAFCVQHGAEAEVRALYAVNDIAAEYALSLAKEHYPYMPMVVWAPPSHRKASLRARGMMRIINVSTVLSALAFSHPKLSQTIKVTDKLLPQNNHTYIIKGGRCSIDDVSPKRPDLDVKINTLTSLLFSSERIGDIFGLPTRHPMMPLMLD